MPGRTFNKPTFFVFGAQRCGTSWLFEMLSRHPDVYIPGEKELDYFNRKIIKSPSTDYFDRYDDSLTGRAPILGDLSINYSMMPERVVERFAQIYPNAKLVFVMRNPVDRSWSQIKMVHDLMSEVWRDLKPEGHWRRRKAEELTVAENYCELAHPRVTRRSNYQNLLDRWAKYFGPESIHIELFDYVQTEPVEMIRRILQHVGASVDGWVPPEDVHAKVYSSPRISAPDPIKYWLASCWLEPTRRLNQMMNDKVSHWVSEIEQILETTEPWKPGAYLKARAMVQKVQYEVRSVAYWALIGHRLRMFQAGRW